MHEASEMERPMPPMRQSAMPPAQPAWVRRLSEPDRAAMEALFALEPGYSLFLAGNLSYLDSSTGVVRYWGAFTGDTRARLIAALMLVGRRATLYAAPETEAKATTQAFEALAQVAANEQVDFIMGQPAGVDALLQLALQQPPQRLELREEHYLAECRLSGERMPVVAPPGVVIRRAQSGDLESLTTLYYRTDGFESLSKDQVRRTLYGRIRSLRTWVAESGGRLLSAASTSAETANAAMIGGVWTAPDARRRGLSTAVMAAISRELLGTQRRPYLFYLTDNLPAAHVYARVGYHILGRWSIAYLTPQNGKDGKEEV